MRAGLGHLRRVVIRIGWENASASRYTSAEITSKRMVRYCSNPADAILGDGTVKSGLGGHVGVEEIVPDG